MNGKRTIPPPARAGTWVLSLESQGRRTARRGDIGSRFVSVAVALFLVPVGLGAADWKNTLEESLKASYELTKTGVDRVRITKPGTVLVVRKEGISGDLASDLTFLNNKVQDGKIAQAGGLAARWQDKKTSRVFKPGEKLFLFKIDVKDDEVQYFLLSSDTFEVNVKGSTRQTRYKSLLTFYFSKGFLESADAAAVKKTVHAVVAPEAEVAAANTKSVDLGQSPEQVEAVLGKPEKVINLGPKKIYVYRDMKIVFADGKVADVQ